MQIKTLRRPFYVLNSPGFFFLKRKQSIGNGGKKLVLSYTAHFIQSTRVPPNAGHHVFSIVSSSLYFESLIDDDGGLRMTVDTDPYSAYSWIRHQLINKQHLHSHSAISKLTHSPHVPTLSTGHCQVLAEIKIHCTCHISPSN